MRLGVLALALLGVSSAAAADAQSWEVSFLAGYTPSVSLDRQAPELDGVKVRGGFTAGLQTERQLTQRFGAELMWTQQWSAQQIESAGGKADLFTFAVDDLHADGVFHFARKDATLRPFVFAGLGATFFSGGSGVPAETKFSLGLGAGVKYFRWKSFGLRGHVRYKPILLNDKAAVRFCDPFGFCQDTLHQFEVVGGAVVRF